jgi:hypothetical protein
MERQVYRDGYQILAAQELWHMCHCTAEVALPPMNIVKIID